MTPSITGVTIIPAGRGDFPAIADLLAQSRLPIEGLAEHLATTLIAREGGHVVGSAALEVYGPSALLRSVAVQETLRGRGLGQRLTAAALDLARRNGVERVYLLTDKATSFFPRFGFRTVARSEVHPDVLRSAEFRGACPTTATVMEIRVVPRGPGE